MTASFQHFNARENLPHLHLSAMLRQWQAKNRLVSFIAWALGNMAKKPCSDRSLGLICFRSCGDLQPLLGTKHWVALCCVDFGSPSQSRHRSRYPIQDPWYTWRMFYLGITNGASQRPAPSPATQSLGHPLLTHMTLSFPPRKKRAPAPSREACEDRDFSVGAGDILSEALPCAGRCDGF